MEEARSLGFEVDYLCDAPSDSNVSKAFGRINKKFIQLSTNRYFSNEIKPLIGKNQYDYVLLIGGMTFALTEKMMEEIRKSQSKAKFMMYQWIQKRIYRIQQRYINTLMNCIHLIVLILFQWININFCLCFIITFMKRLEK